MMKFTQKKADENLVPFSSLEIGDTFRTNINHPTYMGDFYFICMKVADDAVVRLNNGEFVKNISIEVNEFADVLVEPVDTKLVVYAEPLGINAD